MKRKIISSSLASLLLSFGVVHGAQTLIVPRGLYTQLNVGTNIADINLVQVNLETKKFKHLAANLVVGYQYNPYFATEVSLTQYYLQGTSIDTYNPTLVGILPLNKHIAMFAKTGVFYVDGVKWWPFLGAGMSYAITPHLALNVQISDYTFQDVGLGLITLGLGYHFDPI